MKETYTSIIDDTTVSLKSVNVLPGFPKILLLTFWKNQIFSTPLTIEISKAEN